MQFSKSYFEDEVRDGFYVPSMMKSAWAAQLEILEDIDKVCKKYNLQYFAEWGTLLGAIRHGGFVPWDDDMDICMKRKDYDIFTKVAPKEMSEWYAFLNFEHSDEQDYKCDDFLTRLYNGNRIRVDKPFLDKFHGFPYVAGMDIFPLQEGVDGWASGVRYTYLVTLSETDLGIGVTIDPWNERKHSTEITF